jgi:hypothetical protein
MPLKQIVNLFGKNADNVCHSENVYPLLGAEHSTWWGEWKGAEATVTVLFDNHNQVSLAFWESPPGTDMLTAMKMTKLSLFRWVRLWVGW